jgi:hypothetical protein
MRRGTPRRSEQNQLLDEEIGKIPGSYLDLTLPNDSTDKHIRSIYP